MSQNGPRQSEFLADSSWELEADQSWRAGCWNYIFEHLSTPTLCLACGRAQLGLSSAGREVLSPRPSKSLIKQVVLRRATIDPREKVLAYLFTRPVLPLRPS